MVCFTGDKAAFYDRLMKPGFSHVLIFGTDGKDRPYVCHEWARPGIRTTIDTTGKTFWRWARRPGVTTLEVQVSFVGNRWWPTPGFGCVRFVKLATGFRSAAVTPWQLYCALLRNGARPMVGIPAEAAL